MPMRKQKGQALVYIIALLVPLAMGLGYVFSSYSVANERTRLQNTADAVAYSVATVEARDLNFKAYTNRAMIANQVAIAQVVGLVSWVRWAANVSQNLATVTSWIPYVNAVTNALNQAMSSSQQVVENVGPVVATSIDTVNFVLSRSQRVMHYATLAVAADVAREVAKKNDPDVDVSLSLSNAVLFAKYIDQHNNFSRRFRPDTVRNADRREEIYHEHFDRVEEFREIVQESRDGFSKSRTYSWFKLNLLGIQFDMRRAGGTDLTGEESRHRYGSWIAMDTMSWHTRRRKCGTFNTSWCSWKETIPIGWGAAKNSRQGEDIQFSHSHNRGRRVVGGSWRRNRIASSLANYYFQNAREVEVSNFLGLLDYYDLNHDGLIQKAPGVTFLLTKPDSSIQKVGNSHLASGKMSVDTDVMLPQGRMASMARAEPYFARINDSGSGVGAYRRSDGAREYGNLYNPYWQARLEPMTESEKRQVQAIAGAL